MHTLQKHLIAFSNILFNSRISEELPFKEYRYQTAFKILLNINVSELQIFDLGKNTTQKNPSDLYSQRDINCIVYSITQPQP